MIPLFQAQRSPIQQDELSPQEKQALQGEEQQQKITSYEEAFKEIKEATGVSDTMVRLICTLERSHLVPLWKMHI